MKELKYNRNLAKEYAGKWAYLRNPAYYNYDALGGDCTNFVSQCVLHGAKVMNYQKNLGWYYKNGNSKSPSWTGVEFLHQFLTKNKSVGPYGRVSTLEELEVGDVIQLSFAKGVYSHSLLVVEKEANDLDNIYIACHTFDSYRRKVSSYTFQELRAIHIQGVRNW